MAGVLYIVATPIGNLDDISRRAVATLQAADLVAAEDTRHSRALLNHLGVTTPMVSCHEHNEVRRSRELVERLRAGECVALISDAGTPLLSDPGFNLVRAAHEAGIRVVPIPGPSSIATALCAAGLPADRFHFCGFLSSRAAQRHSQLDTLRSIRATLVLFESRHRIEALLEQVGELYAQAPVVVAKELTKLHERFLRGSAVEILQQIREERDLGRGEFVVLIDNSAARDEAGLNAGDTDVIKLLLGEVSVKTAVKIAARLTGKKKNEIYQAALELRGESGEKIAD